VLHHVVKNDADDAPTHMLRTASISASDSMAQ
jgi:hypothetical protein